MQALERCLDTIFRSFSISREERGIACTSGVILAVCPIAAPICLVLFIFAVAITRYVSLGSILVVISFLIQAIVFNHIGAAWSKWQLCGRV